MFRGVVLALLALTASAFVPSQISQARGAPLMDGKYHKQMWDKEAKMDIYKQWNPDAPRSDQNFNPFERNVDGNACDCSGFYPGEGPYSDPQRPDMNYAAMQEEQKFLAEIMADPKASLKGCPGCP